MPYEDQYEALSRPASGALATSRVAVVLNSSDQVAAASAGGNFDGILLYAVDASGSEASFIPANEEGGFLVRAGGTCTAGGPAMITTGGKFIDWTGGNIQAGRFETGTTTDGDLVRLIPYARTQGAGTAPAFAALAGDGAITPGAANVTYYITKGSAAAITVADPTATTHDGATITVVSTTAFAHTVSNAAGSGFNAGGAASDVGTFAGAKGDTFVFTAYQGKWYAEILKGVTLG
jgi:hypothetical protein